ncbi:MAG: H4MPT-linked C1 transfer pathway protein, partial [Planctomycetota bacterium]
PLSALLQEIMHLGKPTPVAAETFATTLDAYLLLGDLAEQPIAADTADGRPRTVAAAHTRMARMICADSTMMTLSEAKDAARSVRQRQIELLSSAAYRVLARMPRPPATIVLSGHGEFLARRILDVLPGAGQVLSLRSKLGPQANRCATAHALAVLAAERRWH